MLLLAGVAVLAQVAIGAYASEFGMGADETAHYVSGLLIRDYVASGAPSSPMEYARSYYLHYPSIGIGNWPPAFYVLEAAWMLLFGTSRTALLVLMAAIAVGAALLVYRVARVGATALAATAAAALVFAMPSVKIQLFTLGPDILVAALTFAAAAAFGEFLTSERARHVLLAAVLAGLAVLTKGNALALGLLVPSALAIAGRWGLLRRRETWIAAMIAAALAVPWIVFSLPIVATVLGHEPGWAFFAEAVPFFLRATVADLGWPLLSLAAIGAIAGRARVPRGLWAAIVPLAPAVILFHALVPASLDGRYLIAGHLALLVLAAWGIDAIADRVRIARVPTEWRRALVGAATIGLTLLSVRTPTPTTWGASRTAHTLTSLVDGDSAAVVLVSSENHREGAVVAEFAARETVRPKHYVLRATKVLATTDWNGHEYQARFRSADEVGKYLASVPVRYLVIDRTPGNRQYLHHSQLLDVVRGPSSTWRPVAVIAPTIGRRDGAGRRLEVYESVANRHQPIRISFPLRGMTIRTAN